MRTYVAKGEEAEALKVGANWSVVDATTVVLGRLATKVARMLIGKDKPSFTPYLDSGDHVVVKRGQGSHDRKQGRAENLLFAQRISGRAEGSAGEEVARVEVGLDDTRGGSRDAAEEQAARAAREEIARVPGCGGVGAGEWGATAGRLSVSAVPVF